VCDCRPIALITSTRRPVLLGVRGLLSDCCCCEQQRTDFYLIPAGQLAPIHLPLPE
jgi:hypothetical protein